MRWTKTENHYVSTYEDLELSLYPTIEKTIWKVKLAVGCVSVFSTNISLGEKNDPEEAKELAFKIAYMKTRNWTNGIWRKLTEMERIPELEG